MINVDCAKIIFSYSYSYIGGRQWRLATLYYISPSKQQRIIKQLRTKSFFTQISSSTPVLRFFANILNQLQIQAAPVINLIAGHNFKNTQKLLLTMVILFNCGFNSLILAMYFLIAMEIYFRVQGLGIYNCCMYKFWN